MASTCTLMHDVMMLVDVDDDDFDDEVDDDVCLQVSSTLSINESGGKRWLELSSQVLEVV